MPASPTPEPSAAALRAVFDAAAPFTVGLEEEVMLLDPETLDLVPRAPELLPADPRFKLELPAAHLEIVLPPATSVPEAVRGLAAARGDLVAAVGDEVGLVCAGVHPFAAPLGVLNSGERYDLTREEHGEIAHLQLVCALQVHVAIGGADRALAVYNGLRPYLPELAALAANAPFHGGRDTGLASVRPLLCTLLPRQGVPPELPSWEAFAAELAWGAAAGAVPEPRRWWWELRPHPTHGTLELRVPDAQASVEDAGAVAAVVQSLCAHLAARYDAGKPVRSAPRWRIEENRWSACRWGVEGTMADLWTGERSTTRQRLLALLEHLEPEAAGLGCRSELTHARTLVERNGALRQREAAAAGGLRGVVEDLVAQFGGPAAPVRA